MAPLPVHQRGPGKKKVFYEYLMTGDKMFAIVKQRHKEIAVKEAKTKKKEECVKTALAKLKQQNRQANKKTIPKKIKNKPQL